MRRKLDIAFCIDNAMALPVAVAILSLAATRRCALRLHLLIDSSARCAALLREVLSFAGLEYQIVEGMPEARLAPDGYTPYGMPSTAPYRRVMLAEHFGELDRILYLDADLLVRRDLGELWDIDLDGMPVGAVAEAAYDPANRWMEPFGGRYFNSGVLLLDLGRWRASRLTEHVAGHIGARRRMLAEAAERGTEIDPATALWGEQTPLNAALVGRWKCLSPTWNLTKEFDGAHAGWLGLSAETVAETMRDPGIFHFAGTEKPWVPAYAAFTAFHEEFQSYRRDLERRVDTGGFGWPAHDDPDLRLAIRVMALQLVQQARARHLDNVVIMGKASWIYEVAQVARRKGLTVAALVTQNRLHHGCHAGGFDIIALGDALRAGHHDIVLAESTPRYARLKANIERETAALGVAVNLVEPEEPVSPPADPARPQPRL